MNRWLTWMLAALLFASVGLGCGDKDKGVNSEKDKPKPAGKDG